MGWRRQERARRRRIRREWLKCDEDVVYFVTTYGWIYDATNSEWVRFRLWQAQRETLVQMDAERLLVILKARQLGISWLCLAYGLWLLLFRPPATLLLFSLREGEAVELLRRLKGMYHRLPRWMQARHIVQNNENLFSLSNGSRALAFSTGGGRGGGRSYTGTLAIVDEADFIPDLAAFLNGVKPTIDAGGKLFLVSTSDKKRPVSPFKNLFRAALENSRALQAPVEQTGKNNMDYKPVFLPWHVRPGRDEAWHARTRAEMFAQRGTDDDFYAEYPATPEEALAPEQLDRRIPWDWLKRCVGAGAGIDCTDAPAIPGFTLYRYPEPGKTFVIGADPAEGNPNSDASAATVVDVETWEEAATLSGKLEPSVFAAYIEQVSAYYNHADVMVERNNHGHSMINSLLAGGKVRVLNGYDGRPGWLSNVKGKPLMYDALAEAVRDGACTIHTGETVSQLASIEASTLRAPEGLHDDRADSFALCIAALVYGGVRAEASRPVAAHDPLAVIDASGEW